MWFLGNKVRLSVVVIVYNMEREASRTLYSLSKKYQLNVNDLEYEVLVIDNGSTSPLGEDYVKRFGDNFRYFYLDNPPPSPAYAINYGVEKAKGEFVGIVIDGAHMLTPGVLQYFQYASTLFKNPVITTRYWFLGPGQQGDTIFNGYNKAEEDILLERINWPSDGYRLFEIGVFIGLNNPNWFTRSFESNYLFVRKTLFHSIGGANTEFDIPGGGFLNLDMLKESTKVEGITLVSILGEASFHQLHGGTTTNVSAEEREAKVAIYRQQYKEIRGEEYSLPTAPIHYIGHMPPQALR
jgi:glycosyltransferase involved in cell wall biosynthesis